MKILSLILIAIAFLLESSISTLPLVLITVIVLTVIYKDYFVFILAFIFGLLLDISTFKSLGLSSLFFVSVVFLILIYQSKFEIKTGVFVILASVLGSFCFLLIFGYSNIFIQSFVSLFVGILIFQVLTKFTYPMQNTNG